jgi:hypothetical protein
METIKYKTMTRTQLAQMYQVCLKTFNKMLVAIPDFVINTKVRILTPKQVGMIIEHLGEPPD